MQLARRYPLEIISADSRQVFCTLNIGTGKPTPEEQRQVRTHLIDCIPPGERFNAARFVREANEAIAQIRSREMLPLIVGGTGMYLKALTEGIIELDDDDMAIRQALEIELAEIGEDQLWAELQRADPLTAAKIHPKNHYRLLRALEIFRRTGRTRGELMQSVQGTPSPQSYAFFLLIPDRAELYAGIDRRVEEMISAGWLDEVAALAEQGLSAQVRHANVLGYGELFDVYAGRLSLDSAVASIKQQTRNYAKRQLTWCRHQHQGEIYSTAAQAESALQTWLEQKYFS